MHPTPDKNENIIRNASIPSDFFILSKVLNSYKYQYRKEK